MATGELSVQHEGNVQTHLPGELAMNIAEPPLTLTSP